MLTGLVREEVGRAVGPASGLLGERIVLHEVESHPPCHPTALAVRSQRLSRPDQLQASLLNRLGLNSQWYEGTKGSLGGLRRSA